MPEAPGRTSIFATLPGLLALVFFALLSIYFKALLPAVFFIFLALFLLAARSWSKGILKRISISVSPICTMCQAGGTIRTGISVTNRCILPITWMDIICPAGARQIIKLRDEPNISFRRPGQTRSEPGMRERLTWLTWQQELSWESEIEAVKRGSVNLDGVFLRCGDGFGLSTCELWYPLAYPVGLLIYPRIFKVHERPFGKLLQDTASSGRGETEDVTLIKSSRGYMPMDPARRINWRRLAVSGRMEVNVYETIKPGRITFAADLMSFRRTEEIELGTGMTGTRVIFEEVEFEEMVSAVASCISAVIGLGIPAALIIPGYGTHEPVICIPENVTADESLSMCMEQLALLDYNAEEAVMPESSLRKSEHRLGNIFICSMSPGSCSMYALAEELGRGRARFILHDKEGYARDFECLSIDELRSGTDEAHDSRDMANAAKGGMT